MHNLPASAAASFHDQRLTLRSELAFTPQRHGADVCYVIEDPVSSKFYRVGVREYALICKLDGRLTMGEVLRAEATGQDGSLSAPEVLSICSWLWQCGLLQTGTRPAPRATSPVRPAEAPGSESGTNTNSGAPRASTRTRSARPWNPICFRLPLVYPDRWFERTLPFLGWIISWPALATWGLVVCAAVVQLVPEWNRWRASSTGILAPGNWLWLALCWVCLKFVHELAHGIACKRYGGTVRELGLCFVLFSPLAYVDVTSSWRFRSRWQRIATAAAGMYAELFVAAIATIVWTRTEPGLVNHVCYNLVLMASVATILFNANPLMRYDGYYILTDLLGIPNLSQRGQQHLHAFARRWLLGIDGAQPFAGSGRETFIRLYGWAAAVWRITVSVSIMIGAAALFHGAGIILAALAFLHWVVLPVIESLRAVTSVRMRSVLVQTHWSRLILVTLVSGLLLGLSLFAIPWPLSVRAPAVVEFAPRTVVRTTSDGFVDEVFVCDRQLVVAGQPLARLVNEQLELELHDLQLQIEESELRARIQHLNHELAASQAEQQKLRSLESKIAERQDQVTGLTVRAPVAGMVTRRDLDAIAGTYLKAGAEILAIGNPDQKELCVAIAQDDLQQFHVQVGKPVRVRLPGRSSFVADLQEVMPRASNQAPHPALSAASGGPLAVRPVNDAGDRRTSGDFELVSPCFTGIVPLPADKSRQLWAGQTGTVSLRASADMLGPHVAGLIHGWVEDKFRRLGQPPRP